MKKMLALDVGDEWTGTALSDILGMFARPYKTVHSSDLQKFLSQTLDKEPIGTIVVGYPKTMRGTESAQTKKVVALKEELEKKFTAIAWVLWDERLSSRQAGSIKKARTKEEKLHAHSIAAALILSGYLEFYKNKASL